MNYIFKDLYKAYANGSFVFTSERIEWTNPVGYKIHMFSPNVLNMVGDKINSLFVFCDIKDYLVKTFTIVGDNIGRKELKC